MQADFRPEVVKTVAEIGPGPFTLLFLWSLFQMQPATVPQIENMIRAQFTRPSIRTYLRKLQAVGLVSGNAGGVWIPSAVGKSFFSNSSIGFLDSSQTLLSDSILSTTREKNFFPEETIAVLAAFGIGEPSRTRIAETGIPARTLFNLGFNLMGEAAESDRLTYRPGLLIHHALQWEGALINLEANPYELIHAGSCTCAGCNPTTAYFTDSDPVPDPLNPEHDDFDLERFITEVWK